MYEAFYGLREKPFALTPDPAFLYLAKKHATALALLEYGLSENAGICLIAGEIGCGKTTLIRHFLDRQPVDLTVGLISNTHSAFGDLLPWVLMAYGLDYRGKSKPELYQAFLQFVISEYAAGRRVVLIVDEAQNLDAQTLEELRLLSNVNADKDLVLQLVLSGQPELREKIRQPSLAQLAQRVAIDYYLEPLGIDDVFGYVNHRLKVAGGRPEIFDPAAVALIFYHSRGVPRLINNLCDTCLVYGYAEGSEQISERIVAEVARDKQAGRILPIQTGEPHKPRLASK